MADVVHRTRVPVSQTIPDQTRRTILTAIPAAAIGVGALLTTVPAFADPNEARLLEIESELAILMPRHEALYKEWDRSRAAAARAAGDRPVGRSIKDPARRAYDARRRHERFVARQNRLEDELGANAIKQELQSIAKRQGQLSCDLWDVRATSIAALKTKARIAVTHGYGQGALAHDILAL